MARPLRLEFPGAVYHVTSRGDRREAIYEDDNDRVAFLAILGEAADRFEAQVLAYCLMGNHYHLVLHTRRANLGRFMRHLNGVYAQTFNRRHGLVGHVLQGRFKAILVDRDAYLLALCRYVERNPVAARIVKEPGDWAWSSYRAHTTQSIAPDWLDVDGLHAYVLGHELRHVADRREAGRRYASLVADSADVDASIWQRGLTQQIYLGDEAFVARMQAKQGAAGLQSREVPRAQRKQPGTLADCLRRHGGDRDAALVEGYRELGLTMSAMARELGLSVSRVSRIIAAVQAAGRAEHHVRLKVDRDISRVDNASMASSGSIDT
jgi:REP element-mobilizing transposase RayT